MARGRMLNNSVSASLKFHNLPDDTCRLMATWLISHLDYNGVFYGDPAMVKSVTFPRRTDISVEQIEQYLNAMQDAGLIVLFDSGGDTWQYWPGFAHNQVGLRPDKEAESHYASPPIEEDSDGEKQENDVVKTESGRSKDGSDTVEQKGTERNRILDAGASKPSVLVPDTPASRKLFARLAANARAKGWRAPKQFKSLEQKRKFDDAALVLGDGLDAFIVKALEQERTSLRAMVNYVSKCAENGHKSDRPRVIKAGQ